MRRWRGRMRAGARRPAPARAGANSFNGTARGGGVRLTYGGAGVDVPAIERSQRRIGRIIASTHGAAAEGGGAGARTEHGFGHYAGIVEVAGGRGGRGPRMRIATHTDGVGTKAMIASMMSRYDTIGIDCVAMNVNDIVCVGAEPVSFVDYIAAGSNDERIFADIARGLAAGARAAGVPIVGGETAVMPGMFGAAAGRGGGRFSFDLAGTAVGVVRGRPIMGDAVRPGDVIVGAASSGLHSNGYTLARAALLGRGRYGMGDTVRGVGRIGAALLRPTRIYARPALEIAAAGLAHGLAHITGGSFSKLSRLNAGVMYDLDALPRPPAIMRLIADQGVDEAEMHRTFNMGIGFCAVAPPDSAGGIVEAFRRHRIRAAPVGTVKRGRGVRAGGIEL